MELRWWNEFGKEKGGNCNIVGKLESGKIKKRGVIARERYSNGEDGEKT